MMQSWYSIYQRADELARERRAEADRHHRAHAEWRTGGASRPSSTGDGGLGGREVAPGRGRRSWTVRLPRLDITITLGSAAR